MEACSRQDSAVYSCKTLALTLRSSGTRRERRAPEIER